MNAADIIVKMVKDRWQGNLKNFNTALDSLTDEQLQAEISPGRNRGVYLIGHLMAVHDDMLVLLNLGEKQHPEFHTLFLTSPDKSTLLPDAKELRELWRRHSQVVNQKIDAMKADEWFAKHTAVSDEDFSHEPHRNKLNILLTRTTHLAYHTGQFVLLTKNLKEAS